MNNVNELASKRTVNETVELVKNSPSSIFTKDDVVNLLSAIGSENGLSRDKVDRLLELIEDNLRNVDGEDMVDKSTAEFSLDGNQIELDSVEVDSSYVYDEVESAVNHWYSTNF